MTFNRKHEYKCHRIENHSGTKYEHSYEHITGESLKDWNLDLDKEEKTLKTLLNHLLLDRWVEHNRSHEEELKNWAEKSKAVEEGKTVEFIQKAVEFMEKSNEMLIKAKESM